MFKIATKGAYCTMREKEKISDKLYDQVVHGSSKKQKEHWLNIIIYCPFFKRPAWKTACTNKEAFTLRYNLSVSQSVSQKYLTMCHKKSKIDKCGKFVYKKHEWQQLLKMICEFICLFLYENWKKEEIKRELHNNDFNENQAR